VPTLKQLHREINNRDYVVGRLERARVPKQAAWDYQRAHQDKLCSLSHHRLNEWLDAYVAKLQAR